VYEKDEKAAARYLELFPGAKVSLGGLEALLQERAT
jgi:hypothetical protein